MNAMWKQGAGHGIAYTEDRGLALALIRSGMAGSRTLNDTMAVYYTARGRAFAWQLLFPGEQWDAVARTLDAAGEASSSQPAAPPEDDPTPAPPAVPVPPAPAPKQKPGRRPPKEAAPRAPRKRG